MIDYSSMSISDICDDLLGLIREAPIYLHHRRKIEQVKHKVRFLELPEERLMWLNKIGFILNAMHESYGPTGKLGDNRRNEDFWDPIKERMTKAFLMGD